MSQQSKIRIVCLRHGILFYPSHHAFLRKVDTLKIFLMILWETKSLDNKKYIALSQKVDEIGRMLGGWNGQLQKQNSPSKTGEK